MLRLVSIAVVLSTEALLSLHFYCLARGFFDFLCHKSVFGAKHTEAKKENVDATMCRIKTEDEDLWPESFSTLFVHQISLMLSDLSRLESNKLASTKL